MMSIGNETPDPTDQYLARWLENYGLLPTDDRVPPAVTPLSRTEHWFDTSEQYEHQRTLLQIRSAAAASVSEAEFVRRTRCGGLAIWARRYDSTGYVAEYAVELGIGTGRTCSDTALGRDVSLPTLRQNWAAGERALGEACAEWRGLRRCQGLDRDTVELTDPVMWQRAIADAEAFNAALSTLAYAETDTWAWAAGRLAGVFAAWSMRVENASRTGPFAAMSAELARSAQMAIGPREAGGQANLGRVAFALVQLVRDGDDPGRESLLLLLQLTAGVISIGKAHRGRAEHDRTASLIRTAGQLDAACRVLCTRALEQGTPLREHRRPQ